MNVKGIVLAGGKSSRFGGDKALACIHGITMLERAVHLLEVLNLDPVVITNQSRDYSFLKCRSDRDWIPGRGPLGGLDTACRIFKNSSLLVLTCDMPALIVSPLQVLLQNHEPRYQATVFRRDENQIHPFPGIYESSLGGLVSEKIQAGELSMQAFLRCVPDLKLLPCPFASRIFLNVNRQEEARAGGINSTGPP